MPEAALCQQVSFVVPVLNEAAGIGAMLRDLRARYAGSEIIVVDGGSVDQTVARAMPLCDQLLTTEAGRARQMNLGGRVASNSYVFFLHADSSPGVAAEHLAACLARQPQWGFCRVRLSGSLAVFRVIERFMNWRSRLSRVATGDQMLFLRKSLFQQTQGFELIPLMEDVAYCKRLRRLAPPLVIEEPVTTSSRRWEEQGVARTVLRMWVLRFAYFCGVSPHYLWRHYYGR